jgi:hypothetical protein
MSERSTNPETIRKRNKQKNETNEQREARQKRDRERKRKKKAEETEEERNARLTSVRENRMQKKSLENSAERNNRRSIENERKRNTRNRKNQNRQEIHEEIHEEIPEETQETAEETNVRPKSAQNISEDEHKMLQNFRKKMDQIEYNSCPVCNERSPSMVIVQGMCRRCYTGKLVPKKFSEENNMDPGDVPDDLKGLTEIEEMLIAQVFPVMTVYRLRGGQTGYKGNVINFPQDIQEFTKRLPRHPSSLDVLLIRRQSANDETAFRDFTVRRNKVGIALAWLKSNNSYYADVIIDEEILKSLPENDSIAKHLQQLQNDQLIDEIYPDEESSDDIIARSFVHLPTSTRREEDAINDTLDRIQSNDPPLLWPKIDGTPINEFQTPGYIARAFPTLYPHGKGDLRSERAWDINPAEYFKHLMWYKDGRFARHPRWRYFALNSTMRWRALQEGKVYVKQNLSDSQIVVSDIQEMIAQGDQNLADKIMRYGEGLRGCRQYWMARRNELSDFIKQIGHQGLVFFTFSAADLHWPELHKLMPDEGNTGEERISARQRQQNLVDNPHIAAWFFDKRFKCFLEDVLIPQWDLEDYWYRFEWQHRGSVHVHGIGKIKNAPIINWNDLKTNENELNNVIQYIDSIVTTINPDMNADIPEHHPCQKTPDEIDDSSQDYVELINKLQRHTRCSPSYCIRVNRSGQQSCRFGYPKDHLDRTLIREDGKGQPELITARNDPFINPHNRLQLQGWRANVDIKPILSIHAALQYISKYASKGEPRSKAFSEIFNQILNNSNPDDPSLTSIQKLLLSSVAERDISAQETSHLLLGIPLHRSSRTFVSLNVNKESARWVQGSGSGEKEEEGRTTQSALKRYWNRPETLENFSLFKLNLTHKLVRGVWKPSEKENIIRIWPRPSPVRNGGQWEEFCRVKILLHVHHRSLQELKENDSVTWSSVYNQHLDVINNDPDDLLGPPVNNEEELPDEESQDELLEDEEEEEFRNDWMHLAEMGPKANIVCSSDLGSRDIDRNHDCINETQQRYPSFDIENAGNLIREASNTAINDLEKDDSIDYESLNEKQKIVFNRIEAHYNNILTGNSVEPLRIIIMGTAGTGKSYLIRAIRRMLSTMGSGESDGSRVPVKVIAPTGVASFNINGATIHSTLSIPIINNKRSDLEGNRLKQVQERLKNIIYFIIDEKSMVGRRMLALVDKRLREAFPENKSEPFGGRSIILFGDFGQLPPVLDLPMYAKNVSHDTTSNDGIASYKNFREVYKLDVIQRQSGDSEEQKGFREILLRLRNGESSLDDWQKLSTRFESKLNNTERNRFTDAVFILTIWADVDRVNTDMIRSLNRPIAKILAVHTGGSEAKKADSDVAKGLEAMLLLAKGARVMLTANIWTEGGLVNGSMGTILDIIFAETGPPSLPAAVLVKFDLYEGPSITTPEGDEVVPIVPIKRSWEGKGGSVCSRLQVPICLAWAITVHKSQGLTLPKAKIDLGSKEFAAGLSFVAVSRVRSLNDIYFKQFNFERIQRIKSSKRLQERKAEEERLVSLIPRE